MKLEQWIEQYLFSFKKNNVKTSTMEYYKQRFAALKPLFDIDIRDLTVFDVQNFINSYSDGRSYSTVRGSVVLLRQACEKAIQANLIRQNPCDGAELPTVKKKEVDCLSDIEVERLLRCDERCCYYPLILFLLYSGVRVGEALALTVDNIDFRKKVIYIVRNQYRGQMTTPKTYNSNRDIPLTADLEKIIRSAVSAGCDYNALVFKNTFGRMVDYHVLLTSWQRQQIACGFKYLHGLHSLRHTYASNLIHNGADTKTVSLLLGHKDISTTLNFYCHSDIKQKHDTVSLLSFRAL